MTFEQLRIFVFVAERQHVTRAARALHITQSAASAAIAALEERHGLRLFDRVGRGLVLSAAGRRFLPEARAVLARAASATRVLDDLAGLRGGSLEVAASQTVSNYWLPARLARFAAAYPAVGVRLSVGNTAQVSQFILEGLAELGFVEGEVTGPALVRSRVGADRIGLYAAPDHPAAARTLVPGDLERFRWALREPGSGTRSEFEHALAARGVDPARLRPTLELPSNEAILAAVAGGGLVTAVSELAAAPLVAAGRVVALTFTLTERAFELIVHRERSRSHAAAAFLAQIATEAR